MKLILDFELLKDTFLEWYLFDFLDLLCSDFFEANTVTIKDLHWNDFLQDPFPDTLYCLRFLLVLGGDILNELNIVVMTLFINRVIVRIVPS